MRKCAESALMEKQKIKGKNAGGKTGIRYTRNMDAALLKAVDSLSRRDKAELYERLQNQLYEDIPLTEEEKRILDERLEEARLNPDAGIPLEEALQRLRRE